MPGLTAGSQGERQEHGTTELSIWARGPGPSDKSRHEEREREAGSRRVQGGAQNEEA